MPHYNLHVHAIGDAKRMTTLEEKAKSDSKMHPAKIHGERAYTESQTDDVMITAKPLVQAEFRDYLAWIQLPRQGKMEHKR